MKSYEDLGIEVAPCRTGQEWFCWLRSDAAGRYHRFIHLRHIEDRKSLIQIIEALSGQKWDPENHFYGSVHSPTNAERLRADCERLDVRLRKSGPCWYGVEEDDTRGRALPEHMQFHADAQQGKQELS